MDRYFVDHPIDGDIASLAGQEAHHLIHVMRGAPGMRLTLFDGSGAEFTAQVEKVTRSEVRLSILARHEVDRELPTQITLGVAIPKGERQKWLVEKAVELGVTRIVPLRTARSVAQPVEQARARLDRAVVEASKQCGRNRLLEIAAPQLWADFVAGSQDVPFRLLAHPEGRGESSRHARPAGFSLRGAEGPFLLAVGPEGGFAPEEVSMAAAAGWRIVDLGPRILRVETAATVLVALVTQAASETAGHRV